MTYRLRNILIAVGLAVVAALLTVFYVSNYKSSVRSNSETVSVLVAAQDIPQGMLGQQIIERKMLATQEIPRKAIVNGTIAAPEDISGLIATQPIYIGEQVTARRFGPLEAAGVRDQLRGTWRVMQIKGERRPAALGRAAPRRPRRLRREHQVPGRGAARSTSRRSSSATSSCCARPGEDETQASVVDPNGGDGWVMLRLTDAQAQKLYFVYANNDWWLALRPGLNDATSPDAVLIDDAVSILRDGLGSDRPSSRLDGGN